ncbi:hypothetical protein [Hydrogenophaga sp. NFH-34]|uniref:hypothetical protein n=1 Tax=Hydrogenophaga sp. NFH-34 TaxID=2744446 RepID=UPI001F3A3C6B|nr:hypothetical protein [Hydrogenophaga sp. NFH-34]
MSEPAFITDYPALRRPRLSAGVGAKTATMIWSVSALIGILIPMPWSLIVVPIGLLVHTALAWFFKKDPHIMALYVVHEVVPNNLFAGVPSHGEKWSSRPSGYAAHLPLN